MAKATVTKVGMSTVREMYGEDVEGDPSQPVLVLFFENKDVGIVNGRANLPYYKKPSVRTKINKAARKWGLPFRAGQTIDIVRDENGYWVLDL